MAFSLILSLVISHFARKRRNRGEEGRKDLPDTLWEKEASSLRCSLYNCYSRVYDYMPWVRGGHVGVVQVGMSTRWEVSY